MSLRLLVALSVGVFVAGACVAGEGKRETREITHVMLSEETKNQLNDAWWFGFRRDAFRLECESPDHWLNPKQNVDYCTKLVAAIHESYRKVAQQAIKNDDLVEVCAP